MNTMPKLERARFPTLTVARLLPRVGARKYAILVALAVVGGVLPNALTLSLGWLVSRIEQGATGGAGGASLGATASTAGAGRIVLPLAVAGLLFVLTNAHGPLVEAVAEPLGGRLDTSLRDEVMRAAGAPAGIAHLEDPAIADRIEHAEELAYGWLTSRCAKGFADVVGGRTRGILAGAILATWAPWAPLLLVVAYRLAGRYSIQTGFMFLRRSEARTQGLRRARYLRTLVVEGGAAKETRIFGASGWFTGRYRRDWEQGMVEVWRERLRHERWVLPVALIYAGSLGFVAYRIGIAAASGTLDIARAIVMIQSMYAMAGFQTGGDAEWHMHVGAYRATRSLRLREVVSRPDCDFGGDTPAPRLQHAVRFESVRFAYPEQERLVLDGIDLEITAGTSLAIVGENGAGKTTMMKLLARLYDPTGGAVRIDGVDLREIDPASWRAQIGIIFQDFVRYELGARENVGFGARALLHDDEALARAADRAGAGELLGRIGWDATLSRRYRDGVDISGGEWQKIALARALAAVEGGARVLILDEPTANLDVRSEAALYERFLEITRGVTTILISHRFSTVRMADRIVVIEHGRVVESGSHDVLLAKGGRYAEMFAAQASAYIEEPPSADEEPADA